MSAHGPIRPVTEIVARFAVAGPARTDPTPATRSLVDTIGVALAGRDTDATAAVLAFTATEPSTGQAVVWGIDGTCGPSQAALINGTAAHALDFDDACPSMPLHPSTVLWPALLAACDDRTDPVRLVEAIDVGNAVMRALGEVLPMDVHYGRGWHSTATVGRVAAVAALARLRGLTLAATQHALGAVASMAGGSIANFGTGTKPLHAGSAARDAVVAVGLVEAGLTAATDQLEHPKGFLALFGTPSDAVTTLAERLEYWSQHWTQDWSIKRYPCCYGTHRAVDAILDLRPELDPAAIESVVVHVHPGSVRPLIDHEPTTGGEGKFSLPFTVAHALRHGPLGVGDFTDHAVSDPDTVALMRRVTVIPEPAPAGHDELAGKPYALVRVTTANDVVERLVTISRGDARNPLSDAEIDDKFEACAVASGLSGDDARSLLAQLRTALSDPDTLAEACVSLRGGRTAVLNREVYS